MTQPRHLAAILLALALAGCSKPEENYNAAPPAAALWEIDGPDGSHEGWLFGTIHTLPRGMEWRNGALDQAIADADLLVVEVRGIEDEDASTRTFTNLANTPHLAPLISRFAPGERAAVRALLEQADLDEEDFSHVETWAAALILAGRTSSGAKGSGVDRALLKEFRRRPVAELESVYEQLSIFDQLPEEDQQDLVLAVAEEASRKAEDPARFAKLWRAGDLAELKAESDRGMLADRELRAALYTERNLAWVNRIDTMLQDEPHPLIAVGAAHMVGDEGLPILLEQRGYRVRRVQ